MPRGTLELAGSSALTVFVLLFVTAHGGAADAKVPVVDLVQDLAPRVVDDPAPLTSRNGQTTPSRLRRGNVVGVALLLHEPRPGFPRELTAESAYRDLQRWTSRPGPFLPPGCRKGADGIQTWLVLDGASDLAGNPEKVGVWVARGVRIFGLTGSTDKALATSWTSPPPGPVVGLSAIGRDVVRRIFAAGAAVDITSGSATTREDVLAIASQLNGKVVALSANARQKADDRRNLTDAELRAMAATGGLVAVTFDSGRVVRGRAASIRDVVRQIQYVTQVAGIDHVAIGSGYEGIRPADGLETAAEFPKLARALLASGSTQDDVESVFSRNALRLLCPSAPRTP